MDKGIPDCPDCGGKGMCDEHKCEYLEWVYNTAREEYLAAIFKRIQSKTRRKDKRKDTK